MGRAFNGTVPNLNWAVNRLNQTYSVLDALVNTINAVVKNLQSGSGPIASNDAVEKYTAWAISIIQQTTHPYVWGQPSDLRSDGNYSASQGFDCSGLVSAALFYAGFNVFRFSTSSEHQALQEVGFTYHVGNVTQNNLQRGDILWRSGHTGIWTGSGQAEFTGVSSGNSGINPLTSEWSGYFRYEK